MKRLTFLVSAAVVLTASFGVAWYAQAAPDVTDPTVVSSYITGPNTVTIVFSEPVTGIDCDYGGLCGIIETGRVFIGAEDYYDDLRNVIASSGNGTDTITLTIDGAAVDVDTPGHMVLDDMAATIKDLAGNELANHDPVPIVLGAQSDQPIADIYVDGTWEDQSDVDEYDSDLTWGFDAFSDIQGGLDAASEGSTVHVLPGTYSYSSALLIESDGLTLTGPTPVDMDELPYVQNTNDCGRVIDVQASNVTIQGLHLEENTGTPGDYCLGVPVIRVGNGGFGGAEGTTITSNEIAGGAVGVAIYYESTETTVDGNVIHDNEFGVVMFTPTTITDNTIENNAAGISIASGPDCWPYSCDDYDVAGTTISGNIIRSNNYADVEAEDMGAGIYFGAGNQEGEVNIGPDNEIYDNDEGIVIDGEAMGVHINRNQIYSNETPEPPCDFCTCVGPCSGLHILGAETGLDATENWWGDPSGPKVYVEDGENIGPGTSESSEIIWMDADSEGITYIPYCTVADCSRLNTDAPRRRSGGVMAGSPLALQLGLGGAPAPSPTPSPEVGPAAPPPFLFTLFLSRGMSGPEVKALQLKLKTLGFFPADVEATGYFGPITEAAVKAFQKAHGIDQVGFVGPRTRAALNM